MTFLEALQDKGILDNAHVEEIEKRAREKHKGDLFAAISESNLDPSVIDDAAADFFGVPVLRDQDIDTTSNLFQYVPEDLARIYKILPVSLQNGVLTLGMVNPNDLSAQNAIQFLFLDSDLTYNIAYLPYRLYSKTVEYYSSVASQTESDISEGADDSDVQSLEELIMSHEQDLKKGDEKQEKIVISAPVTKTVAVILKKAIETGVSDIHIEALESQSKVRYRLDGVLSTSMTLPKDMHSAVVARVKVLARLKLDERRKPQDGRFPARIQGRTVDFRVSTMPTFFGEKVVIRILDPEHGVSQLEHTGMAPHHLQLVRETIKETHGIILITGPTGSGKSTTLYSMMGEVDKIKNNVISLEDPVEYNIEGVSQSQVRSEIGYTFANGLRSILRQDPDIIMVGEIRDKETAELAIQAALTGHLVFSTLHTNSALGVIPRLVDMGVDPYLIAPTLRMAIAQRLMRRLCPDSARAMPVEGGVKGIIDSQFNTLPNKYRGLYKMGDSVYEAEPSENCPSGKKGRIGVFEMYNVDKGLERIILENPTELAVYDYIRKQGFTSMREDAIIKSMNKKIAFSDTNTL